MRQDINRNELVAYAMDFASYLISRTEDINRIILHGSIARGDFDEKSDVDLFIDTRARNAERHIQKIADDYYKTERYKQWTLKGIANEISLIVGILDSTEWKNLKRAILATGILVYGKYTAGVEKTRQYTLISFGSIKPDSRRVSVYRKLFGFKQQKKSYSGLAEKCNAVRVGTGSLLVPAAHVQTLVSYFHNKKIPMKLYDLWSDADLAS